MGDHLLFQASSFNNVLMACATWPTDLGIWVHRVTRARAISEWEGESVLRGQGIHLIGTVSGLSPSIEPPVAGVYSAAPKRWNEAHSINFLSLSPSLARSVHVAAL